MAARLDSPLSYLRFLAYASYSSSVMATHLSRTLLRPCIIRMTRFAGSRYAQFSTCRFVSTSLTRLDVILVLYFYGSCACLYLYRTDLYIYWVGDGTIPIFNLLCNHPKVVT